MMTAAMPAVSAYDVWKTESDYDCAARLGYAHPPGVEVCCLCNDCSGEAGQALPTNAEGDPLCASCAATEGLTLDADYGEWFDLEEDAN